MIPAVLGLGDEQHLLRLDLIETYVLLKDFEKNGGELVGELVDLLAEFGQEVLDGNQHVDLVLDGALVQ